MLSSASDDCTVHYVETICCCYVAHETSYPDDLTSREPPLFAHVFFRWRPTEESLVTAR
ncbi:Uncharacterised protein [Jonesia denitrificans]|nr:Uncharacterised protein [Jonesia denitrificans]